MPTPQAIIQPDSLQREFAPLRNAIERASGIALDLNSAPLIAKRLAPRLQELGIESMVQYAKLLEIGPDRERELDRTLALVTIHETSFFRDEAQLDVFEHEALPSLLAARQQTRRLRILSVGCATGEEPYTLAILVDRLLGAARDQWTIDILGTDLSTRCLEHARRGVYDSMSFRATNPIIQRRYFVEQEGLRHLEPDIREMVRFERLNLRDGLALRRLGQWDVIFCRHVMVYLSDEMNQALSKSFEMQLANDGYLFVGIQELACVDARCFATDPESSMQAFRKRPEGIDQRIAA